MGGRLQVGREGRKGEETEEEGEMEGKSKEVAAEEAIDGGAESK